MSHLRSLETATHYLFQRICKATPPKRINIEDAKFCIGKALTILTRANAEHEALLVIRKQKREQKMGERK